MSDVAGPAGQAPPSVALPKGGGAIGGMGEKFTASPATGTGVMTVPLAVSPGRSEFEPRLALSYDSGTGNGPFGLGWRLALPAITRGTGKGLPRYDDDAESDVFVLSGAEDLVPVMEEPSSRTVGGVRYRIRRYRPRVEGLFARIERWTNTADPADVSWRSISRDNITTWYGRAPESRIADPADAARIFSWLICVSHDDKGNVMAYEYKGENDDNVDAAKVYERGRERRANRYLKRIRYGNHDPYLPELAPDTAWPPLPADDQWFFEFVLDYGEHDAQVPVPADAPGWQARPDAFSVHRAGFEVRTHRLCRRGLMFHHFPDEPEIGRDCLVGSTDFDYSHESSQGYAKLEKVTRRGYRRDDAGYRSQAHPPTEFGYSEAVLDPTPRELAGDSAENLPIGLDGTQFRWLDLDGDGLPGVLTEQGGAWLYKRNLSPLEQTAARLGPSEPVTPPPGLSLSQGVQLLDLAADGRPDVVRFTGHDAGFARRTTDGGWEPFTAFRALPRIDWADPNLRFTDLDGDGLADILITGDDTASWYPSLGTEGFGPECRVRTSRDEETGPVLLFSDGTESVRLADMSGDGLADLVRIRNGEVCYWPNLGYGRFGPKITMDGAPSDRPGQFDQRRVLLADVDGSGTTDLIYLHPNEVRVWFNQSGNSWAAPVPLPIRPPADVTAIDLLGKGTACLVWSSALPADASRSLRYLDLMSGGKPHLLITTRNNLGMETEIEYQPSTKYYLQDQRAGTPWRTKLPFPVHVVARVTVRDKWRGTSFASTYSYHHGYYDGTEREFGGFGRVEQVDVEDYGTFSGTNANSPFVTPDHRLYQPPVKTVTWYHTGAQLDGELPLHPFQREYFPNWFEDREPGGQVLGGFREHVLPDPDPDLAALTTGERREALRACRGTPLRQEVYELDVAGLTEGRQDPVKILSATSHACHIRLLQPQAGNRHAVFHVTESETIGYHYELDLRASPVTPDPRVTHTLNLDVDEFGNIRQAVTVGYPRRSAPPTDRLLTNGVHELVSAVQGEMHLSYTETRYTDDPPPQPDSHRVRLPCEVETYELTEMRPAAGDYFTLAELRGYRLSPRYQSSGTIVDSQKRLLEHVRSLFFDETLTSPAALGTLGARALPYETYTLAFTSPLLTAILGNKLTPDVLTALGDAKTSGYLTTAGQYWRCSGVAGYATDASRHFFQPTRFADAFGTVTQVEYDSHDLRVRSSTDPLGNRTEVLAFDFRVLTPRAIRDSNGTTSQMQFDVLGMPVALAVGGKNGEGDSLAAFDFDETGTADFFRGEDYDPARARELLSTATMRYLYHFGESTTDDTVVWATHPPCAAGIARERHSDVDSPVQTTFEYSDGGGNVLVRKNQAEPERPGGPPRWIATGRTVLNNKGKPVKQYEPYFSAPEVGHRFEEPREAGVTPILFYDAAGRQIRRDSPDGSYSRVDFSPWQVISHDPNDTVLEPGNAWFARMSAASAAADRRAARLAAAHAETPAVAMLDSLGRTVVAIEHNRVDGVDTKDVTFSRLDAEGKALWLQDARGIRVAQQVVPLLPEGVHRFDDPDNLAPQGHTPCYDLLGRPLFQHSVDAGDRWTLPDAANEPLFRWSENAFRTRLSYDELRRPVGVFVTASGDTTLSGESRDPVPATEVLVERRVYGEAHPDAGANLRGRLYQVYDGAGVETKAGYDFEGNLTETERRFALEYRTVADWSALGPLTDLAEIASAAEPLLEPARLSTKAGYDALKRPVSTTTPDGSVQHLVFNEANLVERVEVTRDGAVTAFVTNVDYNAKGQRVRIDYGNGATTRYDYDPDTFRLTALRTTRPAIATALFADPAVVQDLRYTYDPVGNITEIDDLATVTTARAATARRYVYDARYRLIGASGREHSGQTAFALGADGGSLRDYPFAGNRVHPNDLQGLRGYVERFRYDAAGNLMRLVHHDGPDVDQPGQVLWQRRYQYAVDSNRLLATSLPEDADDLPDYVAEGGYRAKYGYDARGNITAMAQLPLMRWNHRNQLSATARQVVNAGTPETTYYVYDAAGQRLRKVTETARGARKNERIQVGGYEIYREYRAGTVALERETLHMRDTARRIALVETTATGAPAIRYQLADHAGSARVELDQDGGLITYEDYHPFGTTAFQSGRSGAEVSLKRYRYTGKERDDETGFALHGARSYAPWLGRWVSPDPAGLVDGTNLYRYCRNSPVVFADPAGTDPKGASEGSVLVATIDPTLDKKGIGFNTETSVEITLRDGTVVNRRFDRFYQDPHGDWVATEAKGEQPEDLTANELLADKRIQEEGARFKIIKSAGAPPPGHGQFREDIAFTAGFSGEIKPGNLHHVHGSQSHRATENKPATASAALWKAWIEGQYADAPGHENMVRKINPNAAPTWITREQAAAEYAKNTGSKANPVDRAAGWIAVKPNDSFLSTNRQPAGLSHQVIAGTVVAVAVTTAPVWVPAVAEAAEPTAKVADTANKVRVVAEEVGGPKVRVAEQHLIEEAEEVVEQAAKKVARWILE
ncbi:SpvB/TcaC N-terminal domain-containing protein [Amycolatopsis pithecellobii]|nr:SpvB/TcaC N-terminal domain-containing protein [Amycolatopsis pithecellobii]